MSKREDVAEMLERFVAGTAAPWAWDDFTGVPQHDNLLEDTRIKCLAIDREFPPTQRGEFCSEVGRQELLRFAALLRDSGANDGVVSESQQSLRRHAQVFNALSRLFGAAATIFGLASLVFWLSGRLGSASDLVAQEQSTAQAWVGLASLALGVAFLRVRRYRPDLGDSMFSQSRKHDD